MRLELTHYPANKPSNAVVYAPHPWGKAGVGDHKRYEALTNLTGFDVVAIQVVGELSITEGKTRPLTLDHDRLRRIALQGAALLRREVGHYPVRIGVGDSARALLVAEMQTSPRPPFTHTLIRDGVNLQPAELLVNFWGNILQTARHSLDPDAFPGYGSGDDEAMVDGLVCATSSGTKTIRCLASVGESALHNVMLGNGLGGSPEQAQTFNDELGGMRAEMVGDDEVAGFLGTYEQNWNPLDLLDPEGLARHIRQTVQLRSLL